jgi:hypothetical protein
MTGASVFIPVFSSRLAPVFARYVDLKRAWDAVSIFQRARCNPWTDSSAIKAQSTRT